MANISQKAPHIKTVIVDTVNGIMVGDEMRRAKEKGYDYFCTTLTVSPHKNSQLINEIGEKIGSEVGVKFLFSDFKKENGYKRSIELSKEYDLYRQNYCGCLYSKYAHIKTEE